MLEIYYIENYFFVYIGVKEMNLSEGSADKVLCDWGSFCTPLLGMCQCACL